MLRTLLISLAGFTLAAAESPAISKQTTEPVGFMRYRVAPGLQTIGFPLLQGPILAGEVKQVTAGALDIPQGAAAATLRQHLEPGRSYYVEFTAGPDGDTSFVGDRVELNVAATMDAATPAARLRVDCANPRSTLPSLPEQLAGYRFVLRPHVTLADAFGTGSASPLHAGTNNATADQVSLLRGGAFQTYLFHRDPATGARRWIKYPECTPADNVVIPPGTGLFIRRVGTGDVTFEHLGAVRMHAFVQPLAAGYTLVSEPFPVACDFATRGMTEANGFAAGPDETSADAAYLWSGSSYRTVFYATATTAGAAPAWRSPVTEDMQALGEDEASVFSPFRAVLIHKLAADPAYVVPCRL